MEGITVKSLKRIIKPLYTPILNLVNTCITTASYPDSLKTARVVPLLKSGKNPNEATSYRAINILSSISKIIDRIINKQLIRHLTTNKLIIHQHHGTIKGRSTMTALVSMLDEWAEALENGESNAILVLDQSAAYNIICHQKLIEKLKILGADNASTQFFTDYLRQRRQSVTVDAFQSDTLESGPLSVCQGSTLSGSLYLVYTLDYPLLHHPGNLDMENYDKSKDNKMTTFIDDSSIRIKIGQDKDQNNTMITNTLDKIKTYMDSNSLVLNKDKSKILVISPDPNIRKISQYIYQEKRNLSSQKEV